MADETMIYVDLYGNEVAADDPTAQTKYRADELKALRNGGYFPKPPGAADAAADELDGTPVLNSGVGAAADDADADKPHARRTRK